MDHLNLLLNIGQLDWVFKGSSSIEKLLDNIVVMVARHMRADVCSIYIYDDTKGELVLRANTGFDPSVIGKIKLRRGEGIAGTVFEKTRRSASPTVLLIPTSAILREPEKNAINHFCPCRLSAALFPWE
jgi:Signal transduction protein containing GAF and PtsI domains